MGPISSPPLEGRNPTVHEVIQQTHPELPSLSLWHRELSKAPFWFGSEAQWLARVRWDHVGLWLHCWGQVSRLDLAAAMHWCSVTAHATAGRLGNATLAHIVNCSVNVRGSWAGPSVPASVVGTLRGTRLMAELVWRALDSSSLVPAGDPRVLPQPSLSPHGPSCWLHFAYGTQRAPQAGNCPS